MSNAESAHSGGIVQSPSGEIPAKAETGEAAAKKKSIFAYAGFNKLFAGSLCGVFADRLYFTALIAAGNIIYARSAPEEYKGQIQIFATIPLLLLYGLAGSLVDGFDRRKLLALVKGVKIAAVLLLVPLLWRVVEFDKNPTPELRDQLVRLWPWCLAVVVLLNIATVPFGPARAAAVPDVVPDDLRSLGASLMATSGLIALLLAAGVGGIVARTDMLGPALTTVLASSFYVLSTLLFVRLPDAVAVPGNKRPRESASEDAAPAKLTAREYAAGLWQGVLYCLRRGSLLGLIFFECAFWTVGSAFYILLDFHSRTVFSLSGNDLTTFSGMAMVCAGIGLFTGAIGAGKIAARVSPIATYTPAFLLLAAGLYAVFRAPAAVDGGAPGWIYPVMFCLGLGGGALLGRVDADVLAVTDAQMRGRVFSLKGVAFAATILATIVFLSEGKLADEQKAAIALWMPRALFMLLPLAFLFSWVADIAIWSQKSETEVPRGLNMLGFKLARFILWVMAKLLFRYEVRGAENVPKTGPVILAANHASFVDPFLLGFCTPRVVQYTMHAKYYRSFAHPVFRFWRCIPVDERSTLAALKANVRSLNQGACMGIFPEGHVSDDGKLQPPKEGALFLAQRSGAPVVPVAIKGNYQAFPRHAWLPRLAKVTAIVGQPFTVDKSLTREQLAEFSDKLMADLARTLEMDPPPKTAGKKE